MKITLPGAQQVAATASVDLEDFPLPTTQQRSAATAVIAYTGTYYAGMPFQVAAAAAAAAFGGLEPCVRLGCPEPDSDWLADWARDVCKSSLNR